MHASVCSGHDVWTLARRRVFLSVRAKPPLYCPRPTTGVHYPTVQHGVTRCSLPQSQTVIKIFTILPVRVVKLCKTNTLDEIKLLNMSALYVCCSFKQLERGTSATLSEMNLIYYVCLNGRCYEERPFRATL